VNDYRWQSSSVMPGTWQLTWYDENGSSETTTAPGGYTGNCLILRIA